MESEANTSEMITNMESEANTSEIKTNHIESESKNIREESTAEKVEPSETNSNEIETEMNEEKAEATGSPAESKKTEMKTSESKSESNEPKRNSKKRKSETDKKSGKKNKTGKSNRETNEEADPDGDGEPAKPKATIDISEYLADNSRSVVLKSAIPDIVKKEPCVLGIDEAGRGPVLGPMVYGTCFCPISKKEEMAALGFDDSKELTEKRREELLNTIIERNDMMAYIVHVLSPHTISTSMLRRHKYNLNALSHDTAIGLIQGALDGGAHIAEVYVDTVGDPGKYQDKLKGLFPNLSITVAKKADSTYPIVSAASICAKVVRDHTIAQWVCAEGVVIPETGYGSGYPGDEKTKKFLHACLDPVFGFPKFVRFSWSTAAKILESKACGVEWEDDDEEEENAKGMANISSYFKSSEGPRRHVYFEERRLHTVSSF